MDESNTILFIDKLKTWLQTNEPLKISIATVCPEGKCDTVFVGCLLQTVTFFRTLDISFSVAFANGDSLIGRARNEMIAEILSDSEITHIIFVSPEISWNPMNIVKLIIADKDVIGGITPFKKYHFEQLLNSPTESWIKSKNESVLKNHVADVNMIQHKLLKYETSVYSDVVIKNNVAKVNSISTGFLLVRRAVFKKLFEIYHHTKYMRDEDKETPSINMYAIFDTECRNGKYYSPDETFCARYTAVGGEIFADVSIELGCSGKEVYQGNFLASLL